MDFLKIGRNDKNLLFLLAGSQHVRFRKAIPGLCEVFERCAFFASV